MGKISQLFGKKSAPSSVSSKEAQYHRLVERWHKDLYRYAYWLTKDAEVADDLVQETCLRAWKNLDSLSDEEAAKPWLITILRRENARRFEKKAIDTVELDDDLAHEVEWSTDNEHWNWSDALAQLPDEYREPLVLQIVSGFSGDEIANILNINPKTVMTRLFRARNQLKAWYEKHPQQRGQYNG